MDENVKKIIDSLNNTVLHDIHVTEREKQRILNNLESGNKKPSYVRYYWSLTAAALLLFILFVPTLMEFFQPTDSSGENPLALIDDSFNYHSFELPEGWDILTLTEELKMEKHDMYKPENNIFEEIPISYLMTLGKKTEENKYEQEEYRKMLAEENELSEVMGRKNLYTHSFEGESLGSFGISRDGFTRFDIREGMADEKQADEIIINGENVYYGYELSTHIFVWVREGRYYDLFINDEAEKKSMDELTEIVEGFIQEDTSGN